MVHRGHQLGQGPPAGRPALGCVTPLWASAPHVLAFGPVSALSPSTLPQSPDRLRLSAEDQGTRSLAGPAHVRPLLAEWPSLARCLNLPETHLPSAKAGRDAFQRERCEPSGARSMRDTPVCRGRDTEPRPSGRRPSAYLQSGPQPKDSPSHVPMCPLPGNPPRGRWPLSRPAGWSRRLHLAVTSVSLPSVQHSDVTVTVQGQPPRSPCPSLSSHALPFPQLPVASTVLATFFWSCLARGTSWEAQCTPNTSPLARTAGGTRRGQACGQQHVGPGLGSACPNLLHGRHALRSRRTAVRVSHTQPSKEEPRRPCPPTQAPV